MRSKTYELAQECKRQSENCLYTSTTFYIWLKWLRAIKVAFLVVPFVLGSLATWKLLTSSNLEGVKVSVAICAFLAGLLPGIYSVLKWDQNLELCTMLAAEFKNLQDRFRQAALISSKKPFVDFQVDFDSLMERLEQARAHSVTTPEWIFKRAQQKVKSGDYDFDVDVPPESNEE